MSDASGKTLARASRLAAAVLFAAYLTATIVEIQSPEFWRGDPKLLKRGH
jgi:hypothetical protein